MQPAEGPWVRFSEAPDPNCLSRQPFPCMAVVFPTRKGGCCPEERRGPNSRWGMGSLAGRLLQRPGGWEASGRKQALFYYLQKAAGKNQALGLPEKQLSFTATSLPGCAQHNTDTRDRGIGLPTSQKVPATAGGLWGLAQRRVWSLLRGEGRTHGGLVHTSEAAGTR